MIMNKVDRENFPEDGLIVLAHWADTEWHKATTDASRWGIARAFSTYTWSQNRDSYWEIFDVDEWVECIEPTYWFLLPQIEENKHD